MVTKLWYRISKSLNLSSHDTPDLNLKDDTRYWIEVIDNNRTHTTSYKNTYELFDYNIYNNILDRCSIEEGNLSCSLISDSHSNFFGQSVDFLITHKNDYSKTKTFEHYLDHLGNPILQGVFFMKKYSSYKSWEVIELTEENIELKETIKSLREDIKKLNTQIEDLKSQIPKSDKQNT